MLIKKIRKHDVSSFVLLSQDCFGYSRFFVFPYNCEIICSSSVKNTVGSLIGIALTSVSPPDFLLKFSQVLLILVWGSQVMTDFLLSFHRSQIQIYIFF